MVAAYKKENKEFPKLSYSGGQMMFGIKACDIILEPYCHSLLASAAAMQVAAPEQQNAAWRVSDLIKRDGYFPTASILPYTTFSMYLLADYLPTAVGLICKSRERLWF